jgi:general secretion pathway protein F
VPSWDWHAADLASRRTAGRAEAANEVELDRELARRGLVLLAARRVDTAAEARAERATTAELAALAAALATVAASGVPLVDGLDVLATREGSAGTRRLARGLARDLRSGLSLGDALERRAESIPPEVRAAVRAGERSGALPEVLEGLATHLEVQVALRHRATQALLQPALLLGALTGLVLLLLCFLLPRLTGLYGASSTGLPAETRALIAVSGFVRGHGLALACALVAVVLLLVGFRRDERWRATWHAWVLALPRLGRLLRAIATARFASTAAVLHHAGSDALTLLTVAGAASGNAAYRAAMERASERVARGALFSEALAAEPCVDPLLVQVVAVGEKSGALAPSLARAARGYEAAVPRELQRFLGICEPLLLVASGLCVAWILLAALLPIFELYENVR